MSENMLNIKKMIDAINAIDDPEMKDYLTYSLYEASLLMEHSGNDWKKYVSYIKRRTGHTMKV